MKELNIMATKNHEIIKIRNGIARQLREARISAHLSLAQVEKLSGIPANIIDLLEVGIKPVDLGHLHQLAKAYGKAVKITLI
ncbi:MAG: XRE family transcriptional regulator [Alphaproteobacteria bacterium]|jgi:transcriptional regulator with XRE-family HTH domain|nr:XRE family transcriptional regulator [Alphaproteobacteria bacterium]